MAKEMTPTNQEIDPAHKLDAGALFVLKSKGSWLHCGYHLTTSIIGPAIFSLPFGISLLGWVGGVVWIAIAALATFYCYCLLSMVLEHHAHLGVRLLRYRDMATHILGARWGRYFVGPLQITICYGAVIISGVLGGQSIKLVYLLYKPNGGMQLYQFISIFGAAILILAQMPSFHSLRHINLVSLILCLAYSAFVTAGSILIGNSKNEDPVDYSIKGSNKNQFFGSINGIAIITSLYASGIIPEIQATLAPPVKGKMLKGLCICYGVIVSTYFSVAISGYWAFGNEALPTILTNFMGDNNKPLLPVWFLLIIGISTLTQLTTTTVIYLQPTNELLEQWFANPKKNQFSARNVLPRLIFRSLSVVIAMLISAMFPFFGDIMALFGVFGLIPLDLVFPTVLYYVTFKPSKQSLIFWINMLIVLVFSMLSLIGAVASVRQIIIDANTYSLFANM